MNRDTTYLLVGGVAVVALILFSASKTNERVKDGWQDRWNNQGLVSSRSR